MAMKIVDISCGTFHTLAVDFEGKLYAFGQDKYSKLGNMSKDSTFQSLTPLPIMSYEV